MTTIPENPTLRTLSLAKVRSALLRWYRASKRDLPWRGTHDPYAVWLSEIMLQQTRVDTVRPYYVRFLERWPTVSALADADPEEVRAAWSGLGYYRRARMMLECAQVVRDQHQGALPNQVDALRALPGFGRYTAGAVASIAFDRETPAVDGNVMRVLARLYGVEGDVTKGAPNREIWCRAEALARGPEPGDLNQALIELGATLCSRRNPDCKQCPVSSGCVARKAGRVHEVPPPRKRAKQKEVELTALVITDRDGVALERQPEGGLFAGLWCPPLLDGALPPDGAADEHLRKFSCEIMDPQAAGTLTHVLTHRILRLQVVRAVRAPDRTATSQYRIVAFDALAATALPSLATKILRLGLGPEVSATLALPGRQSGGDPQSSLPL